MGKKANMAQLHDLHRMITEYYIEAATSGEELSSGTLAAINSHLKVNDITVDVVQTSPTQNITSRLQLLIKDREEEMA